MPEVDKESQELPDFKLLKISVTNLADKFTVIATESINDLTAAITQEYGDKYPGKAKPPGDKKTIEPDGTKKSNLYKTALNNLEKIQKRFSYKTKKSESLYNSIQKSSQQIANTDLEKSDVTTESQSLKDWFTKAFAEQREKGTPLGNVMNMLKPDTAPESSEGERARAREKPAETNIADPATIGTSTANMNADNDAAGKGMREREKPTEVIVKNLDELADILSLSIEESLSKQVKQLKGIGGSPGASDIDTGTSTGGGFDLLSLLGFAGAGGAGAGLLSRRKTGKDGKKDKPGKSNTKPSGSKSTKPKIRPKNKWIRLLSLAASGIGINNLMDDDTDMDKSNTKPAATKQVLNNNSKITNTTTKPPAKKTAKSPAKKTAKAPPVAKGGFFSNVWGGIKEKASSARRSISKGFSSAGKYIKESKVGKAVITKGKSAITAVRKGAQSLNPMKILEKIQTVISGQAGKVTRKLLKAPVIGPVIEGIFAYKDVQDILSNPELSPEDKKKAVGSVIGQSLGGAIGGVGGAALMGFLTSPAVLTGAGSVLTGAASIAGYVGGDMIGRMIADAIMSTSGADLMLGEAIGDIFNIDYSQKTNTNPSPVKPVEKSPSPLNVSTSSDEDKPLKTGASFPGKTAASLPGKTGQPVLVNNAIPNNNTIPAIIPDANTRQPRGIPLKPRANNTTTTNTQSYKPLQNFRTKHVKDITRARELANQMRVNLPEGGVPTYKTRGGTVTEVQGTPVPAELLTDKETMNLKKVNQLEQMMQSTSTSVNMTPVINNRVGIDGSVTAPEGYDLHGNKIQPITRPRLNNNLDNPDMVMKPTNRVGIDGSVTAPEGYDLHGNKIQPITRPRLGDTTTRSTQTEQASSPRLSIPSQLPGNNLMKIPKDVDKDGDIDHRDKAVYRMLTNYQSRGIDIAPILRKYQTDNRQTSVNTMGDRVTNLLESTYSDTPGNTVSGVVIPGNQPVAPSEQATVPPGKSTGKDTMVKSLNQPTNYPTTIQQSTISPISIGEKTGLFTTLVSDKNNPSKTNQRGDDTLAKQIITAEEKNKLNQIREYNNNKFINATGGSEVYNQYLTAKNNEKTSKLNLEKFYSTSGKPQITGQGDEYSYEYGYNDKVTENQWKELIGEVQETKKNVRTMKEQMKRSYLSNTLSERSSSLRRKIQTKEFDLRLQDISNNPGIQQFAKSDTPNGSVISGTSEFKTSSISPSIPKSDKITFASAEPMTQSNLIKGAAQAQELITPSQPPPIPDTANTTDRPQSANSVSNNIINNNSTNSSSTVVNKFDTDTTSKWRSNYINGQHTPGHYSTTGS